MAVISKILYIGCRDKGLHIFHRAFINSGHTDCTLNVYTGGRHEMLNETNHDQVINDLNAWLLQRW